MRTFATLILLTAVAAATAEDGFRPLFNGKNLDGWVPVNTAPSTWKVTEDGMLHCDGKPIGELRTDRMYQNFILELEWRHLKPRGNAGVFIWADDITARGQPFHRGIEVQVLENAYGNTKSYSTHGDIFPIHGAKMKPVNGRGGSRAFPTENRSKPSPNWNHYRIECREGNISLAVNGKVVTQGTNCTPSKGYICLESEGGIVDYRNIRIKELPDTPVDAKDVAIANRGYKCLYTGVDLSGWNVAANEAGKWRSRDWQLVYQGKAGAAGPSLVSEKTFGDFGFIVDVARKDKAAVVALHLGNAAKPIVSVGADLSKRGWSRLEGTVVGGKLTLSVNGKAVVTDQAIDRPAGPAPLRFVPTGSLNLANIYVRPVKKP